MKHILGIKKALENDTKEPINPYWESRLATEATIRWWANAKIHIM